MVTTREAPSANKVHTKEDALKLIVRLIINNGNYLFCRPHLDREYVLGTVGDRGGGKSGSDAVISIVDFMIRGLPVWSNMLISCNIRVSDETAVSMSKGKLNSGGVVHYESLPIEKDKLLKLDETYRFGCLVIEEINVQFSNVRRFMSNTNIEANELYQQLRKFKTSLIYNVIDEMFVDPQLRALTDIFIRTYDTAFDLDALARKKPTGLDFCWQTYAYSGYLNGEQGRYALTHKTEKSYFNFEPWRGVYNDKQHQERGEYSLNKRERQAREKSAMLSVESSEEMESEINEWQWLIDKVMVLRQSDKTEIHARPLWMFLDIMEHGFTPYQMGKILPAFGIRFLRWDKVEKDNLYKIESSGLVSGEGWGVGR